MSRKKVLVVGAGPGGLTAAMLLANRGLDVQVLEKQSYVGGRNSSFSMDGFTFDLGPTFLMMKDILEGVFELVGRQVEDYLDIRSIDPLYRLKFGDGREFSPTHDPQVLRDQMEELWPGSYPVYQKYMERERRKYARVAPCLQIPYSALSDFTRPTFLRAIPYLDAHTNLMRHLGKYFKDEWLRIAFTFQAKYLGMSPWDCPATFSIISYIEHTGGIHHPIGGLNQIAKAMATVVEEEGGKIHLSTPVERVLVQDGRAVGVKLEDGEELRADYVVLNADFGHSMEHLFRREDLRRWKPERLERMTLSCSTFMLYLGVDKVYDIPHHSIIFSPEYRRNVDEIGANQLSADPSIYIQNAVATDPTLAPEGCSTIYVLVPTTNTRGRVNWEEARESYRERVLDLLETRGGLPGIRQHIVAERMITPQQWETEHMVHRGAVFNLGHTLSQMLYLRPHNQFDDVEGCYLVGGGTHPGSGLPTIFESGRISAGLILKREAWL